MKHLALIRAFLQRKEIFLHPIRSLRLLHALMVDARIHWGRKVLFVSLLAGMAALLFFPTALEEGILATILPVIGAFIGIPLGVGFDWAAFAFASVHILGVFPADLLQQHYDRHILKREP
jgi:uncharacterized membrane protein YeaQ/YmgE (transglycosylase-associated protein family)